MCVANAFSLTAWRVNSGLVGSMKFIECAHRKSNLRLMRSIDGRPFRLQWNSLQLLATCKWQLAIFAQRHSLHASPILNTGRRTQDRRLDRVRQMFGFGNHRTLYLPAISGKRLSTDHSHKGSKIIFVLFPRSSP